VTADPHSGLADALRELIGAVHGTDLDDTTASELRASIDRLRQSIDGPPRARWHEQPASMDVEARRDGWRRWSLFRGEHQALAPPLRTRRTHDADGAYLMGTVTCGPMYEGPPGTVHGGYLAGLFDDMLGACLSLVEGPSGVTGRLIIRYRRPTPLETPLVLEARPVDVRTGRITARATCSVGGQRTAEAEALFIRRRLGVDGAGS